MTDLTGKNRIVTIDGSKYISQDATASRELIIFPVEKSDVGYYVYRATDDLETVDSSLITFSLSGLYIFCRNR